MMTLPDALEFVTLADDRPADGLIVRVEIGVTRKNVFHVWSDASGQDGHVQLNRDEMLEQTERDRQFSPMDYGHPVADFNGMLTALVATLDVIERALSTYVTFKVGFPFPAGYPEMLALARDRLRRLGNVALRPRVVRQDPPGSGLVTCHGTVNTLNGTAKSE